MDRNKWDSLGDAFNKAMQEREEPQPGANSNAHIDESLTRMNACLQKAIDETVPNKKRLSTVKRAISERTRRLYDARTRKFSAIAAQGGKVTKQLRKRWNRNICKANLSDYNDWLAVMAHRKVQPSTLTKSYAYTAGQAGTLAECRNASGGSVGIFNKRRALTVWSNLRH